MNIHLQNVLATRATTCPHIQHMLVAMRHGIPDNNAMVSTILSMSAALEAQTQMLQTIMANMPAATVLAPLAGQNQEK